MEDLQRQVNELREIVLSLQSSVSIPYEIESAFRERLGGTILTDSSKTAGSASQGVNEAGSGTYSVAQPMKGFKQILDKGVVIYIPYY